MNLESYFGEFTARDGKADAGDGASDIEERAVGDDTLGIALLGPGEFARGHVLPALAGVLPTAVFAVSYGVVTRRISVGLYGLAGAVVAHFRTVG
jgi:hypothetical protein